MASVEGGIREWLARAFRGDGRGRTLVTKSHLTLQQLSKLNLSPAKLEAEPRSPTPCHIPLFLK